MTIECYYKWCEHHSSKEFPEDGPFCYQNKCIALKQDMKIFEKLRAEELKNIKTIIADSRT